MPLFQYLKLQPLEADENGISTSDLDTYSEDEVIDLENEYDAVPLDVQWSEMLTNIHDNGDVITFAEDDSV